MTTIVQQANKKYVDKLMERPEWMSPLAEILGRMRKGYYPHIDVIFQKWDARGQYDLYDAYPFSQVHTKMCLAKVLIAKIHVGECPKKDKDIDGNNNILKTLWHPFSGEFWGGTQGQDGAITISSPITFDMTNKETNKRTTKKFSGNFPLEVGYIDAAKTWVYLSKNGGRLARWPYGYKDIWLMQSIG